ncbi:DUF6913 domain-containing protein [Cardinium endosymbiont of Culicoides punctatus]|uniref:DUF6913 domain-containing protein n=1 Tax=Cardinium endosymbiont of Culicoides punctatus TaxID=2304601 RepID=UPI001058B98D|nr:hypothetical protein [Cardinium endosymbiont of Culicoides punctatus]TDG94778.1 hypothetical protein CCPUN_07290 [Cardinium endosymbiont of Culicoides punctatus]
MNLYLIFKFLVLKIITRFLSKNLVVERRNVGLKEAVTIGVLYSYEEPTKHESVQRFIRNLKSLDKKISILCYTTPKDHVHQNSNLLYSFGHEAISTFGKVESDQVKKFIDTPFDYLFHIDLNTNPILDYIIAKNAAKCRVGHFDASRKNLFEVMVKINTTTPIEDVKRLSIQMLHYTKCMEH